MAPAKDSPRERLRTATRAAHAALEARLPVSGAAPGLDDYRDHLGFLLGFHEPLETALQNHDAYGDAVPDLSRRFKSASLRADLGQFDTQHRARGDRVPVPRRTAELMGVLYVIEGATLGARSLLPRLRAAGVVPGPIGTRYLRGYGAQSAAMWRRFCDRLNGLSASEADEAVEWAHQTFDRLDAWRSDWVAGR